MTIFCHFRTLNYHKKHYKPILLAQEVSADPQGPRTTKNKIYFLRGSEPLCQVAHVPRDQKSPRFPVKNYKYSDPYQSYLLKKVA